MPDYLTLKLLHQTFVAISLPLYFLRLGLAWRHQCQPQSRVSKVLPHILDSALLLSGVLLLLNTGWSPLLHSWLTAKLILLMLYILLGGIAIRGARQRRHYALVAGGLALACATTMVGFALNKPVLW